MEAGRTEEEKKLQDKEIKSLERGKMLRQEESGGDGGEEEEEGGKNNEKAIDDSEEDNEERVLMESSAEIFFPALTKITVALGPNGGSITDADYHHETLDNLQIVSPFWVMLDTVGPDLHVINNS
ncbi:hypothetical protein Bca4012_096801 [Brassica carinata]